MAMSVSNSFYFPLGSSIALVLFFPFLIYSLYCYLLKKFCFFNEGAGPVLSSIFGPVTICSFFLRTYMQC
jgi:hypothetical protein